MICNRPSVDYITLTSFKPEIIELAKEWLTLERGWPRDNLDYVLESGGKPTGLAESIEEKSVMQYSGSSIQDARGRMYLFYGTGSQYHKIDKEHKPHYLVRVSGEDSHGFTVYIVNRARELELISSISCSRLDIQLTVECTGQSEPTEILYKNFCEAQRALETTRGQRARRTVSISDGAEGQTVYVGSRASGKFARIYQKLDAQGLRYTRLEVECKEDISKKLFQAFPSGEELIVNCIGSLLKSFCTGIASTPLLASHLAVLNAWSSSGQWPAATANQDINSTLEWYSTIRPAVGRLAKDPATQEDFLRALASHCQEINASWESMGFPNRIGIYPLDGGSTGGPTPVQAGAEEAQVLPETQGAVSPKKARGTPKGAKRGPYKKKPKTNPEA